MNTKGLKTTLTVLRKNSRISSILRRNPGSAKDYGKGCV